MQRARSTWTGTAAGIILLLGCVACTSPTPRIQADAHSEALTHFSMGLLAEAQGDDQAALEHFTRALALDPKQPRIYESAVPVALRLDRPETALKLASELEKIHPDQERALLLQASVFAVTGREEKAEPLFLHAVHRFPESQESRIGLIHFYLSHGRMDDAGDALRDATDLFPDRPLFLGLLGSMALEEARRAAGPGEILSAYEEAIGWLQRAAELDRRDASVRQQLAFALSRAEQPERALEVLQEARHLEPDDLFTARQTIDLLVQTGRLDDAVDACAELELETGVSSSIWLHYLSESVLPDQRGDLVARFHERHGETAMTLYRLMVLRLEEKRYAEALQAATQFKEKALAEHPGTLDAFFYYLYGSLHERTGELKTAEELFLQTIELATQEGQDLLAASAKNYIAYMWAERGKKLDTGLRLIKEALEVDPENGAFIDTLGWIYYMQGRYDEALIELERALELTGEDPEVLEHLGDTWIKLGDPEKAAAYWRRALEINPESDDLRMRLDSIPDGVPASD